MTPVPPDASDHREVAAFIRAHREELVADWRRRVLADPRVPEANRLKEPALRDHVPALIDDLAECISASSPRSSRPPPGQATTSDASIGHARTRHALGYTLDEALREWSHFRASVIAIIAKGGVALSPEARALIHATIDESMSEVALAMHQAATAALAASEKRLSRQAAELNAVIDGIPDAVFISDESGTQLANAPALAMLGLPSVEGLREHPEASDRLRQREPTTGAPIDAHERAAAAALRGHSTVRDILVAHQTLGQDIVVRAAGAPVRLNEEIIAAVVVMTDVTAERAAAARLRDEALFRERFMGIVGHDLRNPLASITLSAQTLLRHELAEGHTKIVRRIHSASTRMDRIIDDLLDLTRSRLGGGIPVEPRPMDLAETAARVVSEFEGSHPDRTIEVKLEGDLHGSWDPHRVAQVLTNLLGNAVHHGSRDAPIRLKIAGEEASVQIVVSNRGAPIPPEVIARIFDPFERATSGRKDAGLGLGLFIVREIVRAHSGTISVASAGDEISFQIELPR